MPVFVFDGRTARGAKISGVERVADSKAALTAQLRGDRITPTKIKE